MCLFFTMSDGFGRGAELLTEALEGGGTDSFVNEPVDNSALTLLPSLLFHALTERLCVIPLGFTAFPGRICWEWVWEKSYGCTEGLASHFPTACLGAKLGLKLPKHLQDVTTFVFVKFVLTLQPVLEAGVFELCVLWSDVDRISLLDCSSTGPTIPSPG